MIWPQFDLVTAVNIAVEGAVTLLSVLAAGFLAFRFALKQIRRERAIDRRLQWYESVLGATEQHRAAVLRRTRFDDDLANGEPSVSPLAVDEAAWHAIETGRAVQDALAGSKLYAPPEIVRYCMDLLFAQLSIFPALLPAAATSMSSKQRSEKLRAHAALLEKAAENLGSQVRNELDLGKLGQLPPSPFPLPPAT